MLSDITLARAAKRLAEDFARVPRGAVACDSGGTVLVFGNDDYGGFAADPLTPPAVERARELLAAAGFLLGPVGLDPDEGATWVFQAKPPSR